MGSACSHVAGSGPSLRPPLLAWGGASPQQAEAGLHRLGADPSPQHIAGMFRGRTAPEKIFVLTCLSNDIVSRTSSTLL